MPAPEPDVFAKALEGSSQKAADGQPASLTTLETNKPEGYVYIKLPETGSVWVQFSAQAGPAEVWFWDGRLFNKINPNTPTVLTWDNTNVDRLVYKIGAATQLTLEWGYE
jgi:hypothetical protein